MSSRRDPLGKVKVPSLILLQYPLLNDKKQIIPDLDILEKIG